MCTNTRVAADNQDAPAERLSSRLPAGGLFLFGKVTLAERKL